jgi:hypothetical protein
VPAKTERGEGDPFAWLDPWFEWCEAHLPKDFVGQVEVNVFLGAISNVNVKQSRKKREG